MAEAASGDYSDWQELATGWEQGRRLLWEATRPVSEWLVERLDPQPGQTILDLAAGTGETGFLAAPFLVPGGRLISSDRSPNMVEAARRVAAELGIEQVDFRIIDGARIALADASLDGIVSRFGYILKGDRPRVLFELRRVLRPGGRLAFAVWAARDRNRWMTVPAEVMIARGHLAAPSADELRLSERRNPESIAVLLEQAGFGEPVVEEMAVSYRFEHSAELWSFVSDLRGPLSLAIRRLDEPERAAVRAAIEGRARREGEMGFELQGVSLNVVVS